MKSYKMLLNIVKIYALCLVGYAEILEVFGLIVRENAGSKKFIFKHFVNLPLINFSKAQILMALHFSE